MKRALIVAGGWAGHQPEGFGNLLSSELTKHEFTVDLRTDLSALDDADTLKGYDLISPFWTMGTLTPDQSSNLQNAIHSGVGLGGIHGGMGDAFRGDLNYEWMVGGHFVGHPYVGEYSVRITDPAHPATAGLPGEFDYNSEQYYMMIDPGISVLAETTYVYEGRNVTMPIAWTKHWGEGRVFYSALGHALDEFTKAPAALQLAIQGMVWAAR